MLVQVTCICGREEVCGLKSSTWSMAHYTDLFNWVTPSLQLAHETDNFPKLSWST